MRLRRQVTVLWRDEACSVHVFEARPVVVGDAGDADVVLPFPRAVVEAPGRTTFGDFVVHVDDTTHDDAAGALGPRVLRVPVRSMLVSAAAHAAVLVLAFFFARAVDPKQEAADRVDRMRAYLSRIAEQPIDAESHVDATPLAEETRDDRAGESGEGAHAEVREVAAIVKIVKGAQPKAPSVKPHRAAKRGGGSGSEEGASSCAAFARADHDPNAAWIEFVLNDADGRPVAGEPYRVTLPDGTVRSGVTDRRGLVCFTGVKPGNARIEWTRLGGAARYVGAQDKPI